MWNLLKVKIEDIRMTLMTKLNRFHSDSVVDSEQMNPEWVSFVSNLQGKHQNQIDNVIDIIYSKSKTDNSEQWKNSTVFVIAVIVKHSLTLIFSY